MCTYLIIYRIVGKFGEYNLTNEAIELLWVIFFYLTIMLHGIIDLLRHTGLVLILIIRRKMVVSCSCEFHLHAYDIRLSIIDIKF